MNTISIEPSITINDTSPANHNIPATIEIIKLVSKNVSLKSPALLINNITMNAIINNNEKKPSVKSTLMILMISSVVLASVIPVRFIYVILNIGHTN